VSEVDGGERGYRRPRFLYRHPYWHPILLTSSGTSKRSDDLEWESSFRQRGGLVNRITCGTAGPV